MAVSKPIMMRAQRERVEKYLQPVVAIASDWDGRILAQMLAAPWLNGRTFECFVAVAVLLYGGLLISAPGALYEGPVTSDLAYLGRLVAMPPLLSGVLMAAGVACDAGGMGRPRLARWLRFSGAAIACVLCSWTALKLFYLDVLPTAGFSFFASAAVFLLRMMAMALVGLPRDQQ